MGRAKTASGGLRRAFSPAFRAGSLYPLARGCRTSWRGEGCNYGLWLRRRRQLRPDPIATARCCSTGSGRLDLDLLISGPRVYLIYHPCAGARALMARPWSARCYGVARQREGSRPNGIGGLRRAFSPAFRAGSLYPLARGCRRSWRGEGCNYGLWLRRRRKLCHDPIATARCCSTGSGRLDLDLLISGPRVYLIYHPCAGARALMARPWSARCYGAARQREGSRQNSIGGSGVLSLRHFSGWFSLSLGAWVPKNLARRNFGLLVLAARCCSTGSGRLGDAAAAQL